MEENLKIKKLKFKNYIVENKHYLLVMLYFFISIILKASNIIDITLPCLFTLIFDIKCFGCGFTRSLIEILKLDFVSAWEYNKMTFIVIPLGLYYIILDFKSR